MTTVEITWQQLNQWLTRAVVQAQSLDRPTETQKLLDRLAAECLREGQIPLGVAATLLHSLLVANRVELALEALMELVYSEAESGQMRPTCNVCGRSEDASNFRPEHWLAVNRCVTCGPRPDA
jgi:hypothetical protein